MMNYLASSHKFWVLTWPNPDVRSCSLCIKCDTKVGKVEVYSLFALFYLLFTLMLSPCLIPLDRGKDCLFINISWQEWNLKIHTQLDSFDRFRAINYVHLKAHNYCSQLWVFHQKFSLNELPAIRHFFVTVGSVKGPITQITSCIIVL